jgi:hypothetical protein
LARFGHPNDRCGMGSYSSPAQMTSTDPGSGKRPQPPGAGRDKSANGELGNLTRATFPL